jgi:transposase
MVKIDGRTLDHGTSEHIRILAVRRVRENKEKPSEVMKSLGLCRTTIYRWLRTYDKGGLRKLKSSKATGPAPKLTDKQKQKVRTWIVGKDPRQHGFDFGLWTRAIVAEMIEDKFGVKLGLTAVGKLLASLEITPQKPLRRAYERDPQAVDEWVNKTY